MRNIAGFSFSVGLYKRERIPGYIRFKVRFSGIEIVKEIPAGFLRWFPPFVLGSIEAELGDGVLVPRASPRSGEKAAEGLC